MELRMEHVKKKFGKKEVLADICLEALSGQCVALLGENGCGKSTLLSILAGTLRADGGQILVEFRDIFGNFYQQSHEASLRVIELSDGSLLPYFSVSGAGESLSVT